MPSDGVNALLGADKDHDEGDASGLAQDVLDAIEDKDAEALAEALEGFVSACAGGVAIKIG